MCQTCGQATGLESPAVGLFLGAQYTDIMSINYDQLPEEQFMIFYDLYALCQEAVELVHCKIKFILVLPGLTARHKVVLSCQTDFFWSMT